MLNKTRHLAALLIAVFVTIVKELGKSLSKNVLHAAAKAKCGNAKKINIKVPAGIDNGQQLRVAGQGEAGANGGPPGDLYVVFQVKPHEFFERDGEDIYCEVPLTFPQVALGDEIEVPTLTGKVKLKIPAGTQTGTSFRLRGKGVPNVHGRGQGDQHVQVRVVTPKNLTENEKELMREFAGMSGGRPEEQNDGFFDKLRRAFKGD